MMLLAHGMGPTLEFIVIIAVSYTPIPPLTLMTLVQLYQNIIIVFNVAGIIFIKQKRDIAVNFIITNYKENGENSILDKTLKALNQ